MFVDIEIPMWVVGVAALIVFIPLFWALHLRKKNQDCQNELNQTNQDFTKLAEQITEYVELDETIKKQQSKK